MSQFKEDLNRIIRVFDGSKSKAADFIGVSYSMVTKMLNSDEPPSRPVGELLKMKVLQCETAAREATIPNVRPAPKLKGLRRVPVVASMRAGVLDDIAADYEDIAAQIDELIETDCQDENAFALIVEGDSMQPRFFAGDRIIIAPNYEPRNGDPVCARLEKDGKTVFKIYRQSGDTIRLESLNPDYKPEEFHKEAFRWIYPAVDMKAKLRR